MNLRRYLQIGCINGENTQYRGTRSVTKNGDQCLFWDRVSTSSNNVPVESSSHNYCRNPDSDTDGVWCYSSRTRNKTSCGIPQCPDSPQVIWSSNDGGNTKMYFHMRGADFEFWLPYNSTSNSSFVIHSNVEIPTRIGALTADYNAKQLRFAGYKRNFFGFVDMDWTKSNRNITFYGHSATGHFNSTKRPFDLSSDTKNIESLAYDWVSKNQYWVQDGEIHVADPDLQHSIKLHSETPNQIQAMVLNPTAQRMYFVTSPRTDRRATPSRSNTRLYSMDLAGRGRRLLLSYPQIRNVQGMAIDYATNRLYWTNVEFGNTSVVMMRNSNSRTAVEVFRTAPIRAFFQKIAIHGNTIYVTDGMKQWVRTGNEVRQTYIIWILFISPDTNLAEQYTIYPIKEMARDIIIYGDTQTIPLSSNRRGSCARGLPCDHVCLPRLYNGKECRCKQSYILRGRRRCIRRPATTTTTWSPRTRKRLNNRNYTSRSPTSSVVGILVGVSIAATFIVGLIVGAIIRCRRRCVDYQKRQPRLHLAVI